MFYSFDANILQDATTLPHHDLSTPSSHASASQSLVRRELRLFKEVKIEELPEEDRCKSATNTTTLETRPLTHLSACCIRIGWHEHIACIICYHDFGIKNPEGIRELPLRLVKCKHVFGEVCIKKWFKEKESDKCPYCRDKLVVETEWTKLSLKHWAESSWGSYFLSYATKVFIDPRDVYILYFFAS